MKAELSLRPGRRPEIAKEGDIRIKLSAENEQERKDLFILRVLLGLRRTNRDLLVLTETLSIHGDELKGIEIYVCRENPKT